MLVICEFARCVEPVRAASNAVDQSNKTGRVRTHPANEERTRSAPNAFIDVRASPVQLRNFVIDHNQHFKPTSAIRAGRDLVGFGEGVEEWCGADGRVCPGQKSRAGSEFQALVGSKHAEFGQYLHSVHFLVHKTLRCDGY